MHPQPTTGLDLARFYLGKLCPQGHDWQGSGHSLRYRSCRACVHCHAKPRRPRVALPVVACAQCGQPFSVKPSRLAAGKGRFCSAACAYASSPKRRVPVQERFWAKVHKTTADGCWLWQGSISKRGYGFLSVGGKRGRNRRAHVLSWEFTHGPVPPGLCVCHRCDAGYAMGDIAYRRCVNPTHLYLGTHQDNMDDMDSKGRANRSGRKPWTPATGNSG